MAAQVRVSALEGTPHKGFGVRLDNGPIPARRCGSGFHPALGLLAPTGGLEGHHGARPSVTGAPLGTPVALRLGAGTGILDPSSLAAAAGVSRCLGTRSPVRRPAAQEQRESQNGSQDGLQGRTSEAPIIGPPPCADNKGPAPEASGEEKGAADGHRLARESSAGILQKEKANQPPMNTD